VLVPNRGCLWGREELCDCDGAMGAESEMECVDAQADTAAEVEVEAEEHTEE
jgi:hypothetical protein